MQKTIILITGTGRFMEVFLVFSFIIVVLSLGCFVFQTHSEIQSLRNQNKDLLNRIMANDYKEYAAIELKKPKVPRETTPAQALMNDEDVFQVN